MLREDRRVPEKVDFPTLTISRNSSIATEDSLVQPSRFIRGFTEESEYGIRRAMSDDRGFQSSIHLHLRDSNSNQNLPDYGLRPSIPQQRSTFQSMPTEDMSEYASDNISIASDRSNSGRRQRRSSSSRLQKANTAQLGQSALLTTPVNYHGVTISQAASQGNLPLCVLLWGMATAKRVRLMDPDTNGDTPMHFAAQADIPEVMSFLHQQTRVKNDPQNRLVDLRNNKGETALHRASCVGKIPTLKFLLDSNSDPFAVDLEGNSVFINLTRCGCIWGVHYVHSYLRGKFSSNRVFELLCHEDHEGHNAMHWAAYIGDVNMIECLARKSMDPQKTDRMGRNALHIAAVCQRLDAFIFLIKCGCDPFQEDSLGQTPLSIAATSGNPELKSAARSNRGLRPRAGVRRRERTASLSKGSDESPPPSSLIGIDARSLGFSSELETDLESGESELGARLEVTGVCKQKSSQDDQGSITQYPRCALNGVTLYATNDRGARKPHAMRRLKQSRLLHAFFYASLVIGCWLLALAIPFYAWILLAVLCFFILRSLIETAHAQESAAISKTSSKGGSLVGTYQGLLLAPERYLGLYIGTMTVCALFWLCSLRTGIIGKFERFGAAQGEDSLYSRSLKPGSILDLSRSIEFLNVGGLSGSTDDYELFLAAAAALFMSALLWIYLVWIATDPGAVCSRTEDFDMILDQSLLSLAPPSDRLFCSTSFVRKPTRSKYCAQTGFVIARMDHYCVWLNNSVGFGNHRTFMVFLLVQLAATGITAALIARALIREIGLNSTACGAVSYLLDRNYFFPTVLCVVLCVITLILTALLVEQSANMARNITANERINRSRYPWMNDEHGQPFNHYDRGLVKNVLEFWFVAGFKIDYFAEFDLLPPRVASDKGLLTTESPCATGTSIDCPPEVSLLRKERHRPERVSPILSKKYMGEEPSPARCRSPSTHKHVTVQHLPLPQPTGIPLSYSDSPMSPDCPRTTPTKLFDSNRHNEQGQGQIGRSSGRTARCPSSELQDRLCPRNLHYPGGSKSHDHVSCRRTNLDLSPLGPPLSRCSSRHSSPSSVQGAKRARVDS